jgi:hypothetical protein
VLVDREPGYKLPNMETMAMNEFDDILDNDAPTKDIFDLFAEYDDTTDVEYLMNFTRCGGK